MRNQPPKLESDKENSWRAGHGALRYFWAWAGRAFCLAEAYPVPADLLMRFVTDHLADVWKEAS